MASLVTTKSVLDFVKWCFGQLTGKGNFYNIITIHLRYFGLHMEANNTWINVLCRGSIYIGQPFEVDVHCGLVVKGTSTKKTCSIKQKLVRKSFINKLTLLTLRGSICCMEEPIWKYDLYYDIFVQLTNTCVEIQGTRYGQLNRN
jgi:hypothetical protein